jgi:hypothetical protein
MAESLVSKQHKVEAFQIVSIACRKHTPTTQFQISNAFNCCGPIVEHFGGALVDVATKTA